MKKRTEFMRSTRVLNAIPNPETVSERFGIGVGTKEYHILEPIAPDNSGGFTGMGQLRFAQKRFTEAGSFFEQGLTRNPHDLQALMGLAQLRLTEKQPARAYTTLLRPSRTRKLFPKST